MLKPPRQKHPFDRLAAVMAALRSPRGCPWDRRQTHKSLKPYLIEEAYEVIEAIDSGDPDLLMEELGDLMFQAFFHAQLAAERGRFDIHGVTRALADKMVRRHPHVFGSEQVRGAGDQVLRWEAIKRQEKKNLARKSALDGVPKAMPALLRARRLLSKAGKVNFQWNGKAGAWAKLREELGEFRQAAAAGGRAHAEEELGDLLLALVNVARFEGLDPEHALHRGCAKLYRRFRHVEEGVKSRGLRVEEAGLAQLLALWNQAKSRERKKGAPRKRSGHQKS